MVHGLWKASLLATCFANILACGTTWANEAREPRASAISRAKEGIARDLRDPSSAQFRDIYTYPGGVNEAGPGHWIVCGEVNGKNAFGAYVGFRPFHAVDGGGKILDLSDKVYAELNRTIWETFCDRGDEGKQMGE